MKKQYIYLIPLLSVLSMNCFSQENSDKQKETITPVKAFNATRILSSRTVNTNKKNTLEFIISHRFGPLNTGAYNFFGIDNAAIRLGLEYALSDRITIGAGRSSLRKTYDGFIAVNILEQTTGHKKTPVALTLFSSVSYETLRRIPERDVKEKVFYSYQLLAARRFGENLSLQLMPTLVHRNVVPENQDNDIYALGLGISVRASRRINILGEYYLISNLPENMVAPIAAGIEIHTWGHYFQLLFTNARSMIYESYITNTEQGLLDGGLGFGFNIGRRFNLKKRK